MTVKQNINQNLEIMENFKKYTQNIVGIIRAINENENITFQDNTKELMTTVVDCYATLECEGMQQIYVNEFNKYADKLLVRLSSHGIIK